MAPYDTQPPGAPSECYTVMIDGKMIGWLHNDIVESVARQLRMMKVLGKNNVRCQSQMFVRYLVTYQTSKGIIIELNTATLLFLILVHNTSTFTNV